MKYVNDLGDVLGIVLIVAVMLLMLIGVAARSVVHV